jgi:hypothetical protein
MILFGLARRGHGHYRVSNWSLVRMWAVHISSPDKPEQVDFHGPHRVGAARQVRMAKLNRTWNAASYVSWRWELYYGPFQKWTGRLHRNGMDY